MCGKQKLAILSKNVNNTGNWLFVISLERLEQWTVDLTLHKSFQKQHVAPGPPRGHSLYHNQEEGVPWGHCHVNCCHNTREAKIRHWITAAIRKLPYLLTLPFDIYKSRSWTPGCCRKTKNKKPTSPVMLDSKHQPKKKWT